jgi:hypothetical protein
MMNWQGNVERKVRIIEKDLIPYPFKTTNIMVFLFLIDINVFMLVIVLNCIERICWFV